VFDLFFQAQPNIDRAKGGLGIGLTLVRRIVEAHGGTIDVTSEGLGKGATFTVRLPAIAAPTREAARQRTGARASRTVVIVEDAQDARISLQRIFEAEGHAVQSASDGVSGLKAIIETVPEVAIVDIGLPGLNGYELAERVRSAGLRTYLIALTGYGLREDKEQARKAGFDLHLTKPTKAERLLELVASAPVN
jgi:CheY-like chemotaxis protein